MKGRRQEREELLRALEKQASREADARAIASGEKTAAQVQEENGAFSFPRERMKILKYR